MNECEKILRRAQIVKGQLEGVVKMLEKNELSCLEIFIQIKAAKQGLENLGKELIKSRIRECFFEGEKENFKELEELIKALS